MRNSLVSLMAVGLTIPSLSFAWISPSDLSQIPVGTFIGVTGCTVKIDVGPGASDLLVEIKTSGPSPKTGGARLNNEFLTLTRSGLSGRYAADLSRFAFDVTFSGTGSVERASVSGNRYFYRCDKLRRQ